MPLKSVNSSVIVKFEYGGDELHEGRILVHSVAQHRRLGYKKNTADRNSELSCVCNDIMQQCATT